MIYLLWRNDAIDRRIFCPARARSPRLPTWRRLCLARVLSASGRGPSAILAPTWSPRTAAPYLKNEEKRKGLKTLLLFISVNLLSKLHLRQTRIFNMFVNYEALNNFRGQKQGHSFTCLLHFMSTSKQDAGCKILQSGDQATDGW